jgi:hypothetical protein
MRLLPVVWPGWWRHGAGPGVNYCMTLPPMSDVIAPSAVVEVYALGYSHFDC